MDRSDIHGYVGVEELIRHLRRPVRAAFHIVLVPGPEIASALISALPELIERAGGPRWRPVVLDAYETVGGTLSILSLSTLDERLWTPLLRGEEVAQPGRLIVLDASRIAGRDREVWTKLFARLNEVRNTVMRRIQGPLLLVLGRDLYAAFGHAAPDFWSIRRSVIQVEPKAEPAGVMPLFDVNALRLRSTIPAIVHAHRVLLQSGAKEEVYREALQGLEAALGELKVRRRVSVGGAAPGALAELLAYAFHPAELMRVVNALPRGQALANAIAWSAPPFEVAHSVADGLRRYNMMDDRLFEVLRQARPNRRAEIDRLAGQAGKVGRVDEIEAAVLVAALAERVGDQVVERWRAVEELLPWVPAEPADADLLLVLRQHLLRLWGALGDVARERRARLALREIDRSSDGGIGLNEIRAVANGVTSEAVLVLSSYDAEAALPGRLVDARVYLPVDAMDRRWEPEIGPSLEGFRFSLQQSANKRLLLHTPCIVSLAVRAGAAFHERTGLQVRVTQTNPITGSEQIWDLDGSEGEIRPTIRRLSDPNPEEVQLIVSAARDIVADWSDWRFINDRPAIRIHVRPAPGPGAEAIGDAATCRAWATDIWSAVDATMRGLGRSETRLPLRIVLAGPNALAVAIGRKLRGPVDVHIMDFDRRDERYVEPFRFIVQS